MDSGETHTGYAAFALDFVPAQPKGTRRPAARRAAHRLRLLRPAGARPRRRHRRGRDARRARLARLQEGTRRRQLRHPPARARRVHRVPPPGGELGRRCGRRSTCTAARSSAAAATPATRACRTCTSACCRRSIPSRPARWALRLRGGRTRRRLASRRRHPAQGTRSCAPSPEPRARRRDEPCRAICDFRARRRRHEQEHPSPSWSPVLAGLLRLRLPPLRRRLRPRRPRRRQRRRRPARRPPCRRPPPPPAAPLGPVTAAPQARQAGRGARPAACRPGSTARTPSSAPSTGPIPTPRRSSSRSCSARATPRSRRCWQEDRRQRRRRLDRRLDAERRQLGRTSGSRRS